MLCSRLNLGVCAVPREKSRNRGNDICVSHVSPAMDRIFLAVIASGLLLVVAAASLLVIYGTGPTTTSLLTDPAPNGGRSEKVWPHDPEGDRTVGKHDQRR